MTRIERPLAVERLEDEWLEADGFGGFASGTVGMYRTRRYHALLLAATRPPAGRIVLVNGVEAWLEAQGSHYPLTMQRYAPAVIAPDITMSLDGFTTEPWPTWRIACGALGVVTFELFVAKASRETVLRWRLQRGAASEGGGGGNVNGNGVGNCTLHVRPLLSGRDYHALHHENGAFNFAADVNGAVVSWRTYGDLPEIHAASNGSYASAPDWYRNFCYDRERERGLDFSEDLATPGVFSFDLPAGEAAVLVLDANDAVANAGAATNTANAGNASEAATADEALTATTLRARSIDALEVSTHAEQLAHTERARRASFPSLLHRSADAYVVARASGRTIVAGFPWFTDWGRDTFIAMRGLLLASQRYDEAAAILLEWSGTLSEGMLPNRFPDYGDTPEYNSVDASLWFAVAVHDYLAAQHASAATRLRLQQAVDTILAGYTRGTRFGIRADDDGLLRAGVPGVQLTWMDAKVGDWVVTPRIGKPVEVQALWINALRIASMWNPQWRAPAERASQAFVERFIDATTGALFDVVDADHEPGRIDRALRPNQIFAVGGLPFPLLEGAAARAVVDRVHEHLLTPLGLRTLSPLDPAYRGRYAGGPLERDGAYHQGTVWPWLLGPFVEAWLRVHQPDAAAREEARLRFIAPLDAHLQRAGLDHLSEVADGDAPHHPAGTPFQAWSLGERLRLDALLALQH